MSDTVYRFLPWSRRGLSAALPAATTVRLLPARPQVKIDVVVGGAGPGVDLHAAQRPGRRHRPRPDGDRAHDPPAWLHERRAELPGRGRLRPTRAAVAVHAGRRPGLGPPAAVAGPRRRPRPARRLGHRAERRHPAAAGDRVRRRRRAARPRRLVGLGARPAARRGRRQLGGGRRGSARGSPRPQRVAPGLPATARAGRRLDRVSRPGLRRRRDAGFGGTPTATPS